MAKYVVARITLIFAPESGRERTSAAETILSLAIVIGAMFIETTSSNGTSVIFLNLTILVYPLLILHFCSFLHEA